MKRANALQWRLSVGLVAGVTVMWIIATIFTGLTIRSEMNEVFDSALEETAQRILPLAVNDIIDREEEGISQRVAVVRDHHELLTYLVRDNLGRVLLRSHDAEDAVFPAFANMGFVDTDNHRIYFDSALRGTITIAVAEPLAHRREALLESLAALLLPLIFLIPLSLFGVWWLVRKSMHPVWVFQREIESRDSGDLAPVSADALPDEVKPVAIAVNNLMDRLRRALESERSFTANSAHELRTPVAAALAQTQRLIAETTDADAKDRARQIEQALKRLSALSEKLMQLAKSEGGGLIGAQKGDIIPILQLVLTDFERAGHPSERIKVELPNAPVKMAIDPNAFAILLRNLIENALKHGDPKGLVQITLSQDGTLRIVNDGPVVARNVLYTLTRPFVRGHSTADGTGLGLAIASAIASGAGGAIRLASPATDRTDGFEVVVHLV